jgi:hypothetical protein
MHASLASSTRAELSCFLFSPIIAQQVVDNKVVVLVTMDKILVVFVPQVNMGKLAEFLFIPHCSLIEGHTVNFPGPTVTIQVYKPNDVYVPE